MARQGWVQFDLLSVRTHEASSDLILRSVRRTRLEGWLSARTRGHPSRRAQERAPQDEVRELSHGLYGSGENRVSAMTWAVTE